MVGRASSSESLVGCIHDAVNTFTLVKCTVRSSANSDFQLSSIILVVFDIVHRLNFVVIIRGCTFPTVGA